MLRQISHTKKFCITLLLGVSFILTGCKDNPSQPPPKPAAVKPKAAAPASPDQLKEAPKAEKESFTYEQKGRRDPFVSLLQLSKEKPKRMAGKRPIENFDVDEIKLIAILWDKNQYYALITLPDNKSYTIRKGMTLGLYGGKVEEISKGRVLIREQVKDYRGQFKTKDTILRLRKEGD